MLRKERNQNRIKGSVKTTKDRKIVEDKNGNKEQEEQTENSNKFGNIDPNMSIITFSISSLNIPIKRQKLAEWVKK